MALLRGCYHQILGPRRHLPKLSNGLCRHASAYVRLYVHLGWQAAESYVERSNAFALIPGHTLLPDCLLLDSQPLKTLLSRDMRRSEGTGRSKGSRTISWMEYRTLWDSVSIALNFAILPRESRDKRRRPSLLPLPWLPRRSTPGRQIVDAIAVGGRERERQPAFVGELLDLVRRDP